MSKNKYTLLLLITVLMMVLQVCKPAQTTTAPPVTLVSYEKDIRPLMLERCTPCHFPEMGKKKMFDTYLATKTDAIEIVRRIQLKPEDLQFMPFKGKKPALTEKEIKLFNDWLSQGTPN